MPPRKDTKIRALPAKQKTDETMRAQSNAEVAKRWFDQLPPTIRKATKKAGSYQVCIEGSGVVDCAQMQVDTYGWVTLLDVKPVNDRPHVNMEVAIQRIIYVVEVPTLKASFA